MNEANYAEDRNAGPRIGLVARVLALTGGAILVGISAWVTTSVVLRTVTGAGIDGDFEIVQLAAAIAAFCLFPLCLSTRGNIVVDTFTTRLPKRVCDRIDAVWDVLFGLIAVVLSWRMAIGAIDQFTSKTTLMVLPIPTWWAVAVSAGLLAFLAITAATVGVRLLMRKP